MTGFATHPLDAKVRYCRTDVGNAYRWDDAAQEWVPMIVRTATGGLPTNITRAPEQGGVASIGIDPGNKNIVFIAYKGGYSSDVSALYPAIPGNVYKSVDGGKTFTAGDLNVAIFPNSNERTYGERISVDPNNGNVVYYATEKNGLWRSTNGGANWSQVTGSGAPGTTADLTRVLFTGGATYVVALHGSVYRSGDNGATWTNISAGQSGLDGNTGNSTSHPDGSIFVIQDGSRTIWKYKSGVWSTILTGITYEKNVDNLAVDPTVTNGQRIYALASGGYIARTDTGGGGWTQWGDNMYYANTFSWLPQPVSYRSTGGIYLDIAGKLWIAQGNEGVLSYTPTGTETFNSPRWTIDSKGIEEFVSHDVVLPPGGKPVVAVDDATVLYVANPDTLSAVQGKLQDQLISNGTGLAYCPNDSSYVVCAAADLNYTGSQKTYSGYSSDGGKTWTRFSGVPGNPVAGSIAVSRRNGWGLGSDHLVLLPLNANNQQPLYSKDGGASWTPSSGFPANVGFWNLSLKQHNLAADPFVADKFYCEASWGGGFYVSTNGGVNWQLQSSANLPTNCHHGNLAINRVVQNDLWYGDGWEGASDHGLWHSTNGGQNFGKITGIDFAITVAVGAGSGKSGDQLYSVYFYGKLSGDNDWGVFRSTNGGSSWDRLSRFPTGLVDQPSCMAASWDTFGQVYIGFNGNSFVYGSQTGGTGTTSGSISREVWTNIGGTLVSQIPLSTAPQITDTLTSLEAPTNWADTYGTRIRGHITAPSTGNYTFWVAGDDETQLFLSTDANEANKSKIAYVTDWTNSREWGKYASQKSATKYLVAGQKYYVEVLEKEGYGGDNVAVGWAKPGQSTTSPSEVVPGSVLSTYTSGTTPATDTAKYNFEAGTQTWGNSWGSASPSQSAAQAFAGSKSLAVAINATGASDNAVRVLNNSPVPMPTGGTTVTFRVFVPSGASIDSLYVFSQDANWGNWGATSLTSITPGQWNTVTLTIPAASVSPLNGLGVNFHTTGAWSGTCYIDSINW